MCTRSVTLSLPSLEDMRVKLKHGGIVAVNSMDIQTPMRYGMLMLKIINTSKIKIIYNKNNQLLYSIFIVFYLCVTQQVTCTSRGPFSLFTLSLEMTSAYTGMGAAVYC